MARLSGFLKRAAPEVRAEIGRLRGWAADRPQLVSIEKDAATGTWLVRLKSAPPPPAAAAEKGREGVPEPPPFWG
eukprot:6535081-Prymnesium_polylepis.1